MRRVCLIFVLLAAAAFAAAASGPSTVPARFAPLSPPYVANRKLLDVDSAIFEWHDDSRNRAVPAKAYFPKDNVSRDAPEKLPVIIFSHGLGGSRFGYEYLGRQWAANGYVVIHLDHLGSDTDSLRANLADRAIEQLRKAANYQNSTDRAKDVSFAIDQLPSLGEKVPALLDRLNLQVIGVAGHSFGGNTTMLIAGQTYAGKSFADSRVKAAIAMSAPVPLDHTQLANDFANVSIPVLMMTGTKDDSPIGETKAADRRLIYDHLIGPAWLLILTGGDHMVFSGRLAAPRPTDAGQQQTIRICSTAFWDAQLKSNVTARDWLMNDSGFKKSLSEGGTFEHKP